ncbi:Neutral ceramidase A [Symbiodinium microadriaticum]|uniref:Neutral ceramidase n=1 Tax=Symbiodinium microadriaticum TaxID=2951 RepID=A0A1Q9D1X8_SYMMI|nr:Neutral ceramidase A [Symbiodinium microadriaticum]
MTVRRSSAALARGLVPIDLCGTAARRMQFGLLASILWSALAVESEYHVGVGIADVTGPAAEVVMMGYADQDQRVTGFLAGEVRAGLHARAFIFVHKESKKRLVYVAVDTWSATESLIQGCIWLSLKMSCRSAAIVWRCLRLALTAALAAALTAALALTHEDQPRGRLLSEFAADGHQGHSWPWQTWIVAVLFVLICGCGQLLCCFGCLRNGWERGDFQTLGPYTPISQTDWSNIFRAPGFWLGCLEHADWFTDGALPVQAYLCGPSVTERFAESFELSMAWPLAPIVRMLHFWGLLTVVLGFAALSQQLLGSADLGECHDLAADVPGFGAVASWYEEFEQDHGWKQAAQETGCLSERALLTSVSKVFLENVAQLWLQASFFALIFGRLHHAGKVKLLISMGLGLISCVCKTLPMAVGLCRALATGSIGPEVGLIVLSCQLFAILGVAWTVAKLVNSFDCPSHLWNLTSGCVPSGALTVSG